MQSEESADVDGITTTEWIEEWRQGNSEAADHLWDKYFARLVQRAAGWMTGLSPTRDGEDIALSAIDLTLQRLREEKFRCNSSRSLWGLLLRIAERKASDERKRQNAAKRKNSDVSLDDLAEPISDHARPDEIAACNDSLRELMSQLGDPVLCEIARLKLNGLTDIEVGERVGIVRQSVARKVTIIQRLWAKIDESGDFASDK